MPGGTKGRARCCGLRGGVWGYIGPSAWPITSYLHQLLVPNKSLHPPNHSTLTHPSSRYHPRSYPLYTYAAYLPPPPPPPPLAPTLFFYHATTIWENMTITHSQQVRAWTRFGRFQLSCTVSLAAGRDLPSTHRLRRSCAPSRQFLRECGQLLPGNPHIQLVHRALPPA